MPNPTEIALMLRKDKLPKLPTNNISSGDITRYSMFVSSLPSNLAKSGDEFDLHRAWELDGQPINKSQSSLMSMQNDGMHMNSVIYNPTRDEYEFLKSKNHHSLKDELDWYNSKEGDEFRKEYKLDDSSDFYKYIKR